MIYRQIKQKMQKLKTQKDLLTEYEYKLKNEKKVYSKIENKPISKEYKVLKDCVKNIKSNQENLNPVLLQEFLNRIKDYCEHKKVYYFSCDFIQKFFKLKKDYPLYKEFLKFLFDNSKKLNLYYSEYKFYFCEDRITTDNKKYIGVNLCSLKDIRNENLKKLRLIDITESIINYFSKNEVLFIERDFFNSLFLSDICDKTRGKIISEVISYLTDLKIISLITKTIKDKEGNNKVVGGFEINYLRYKIKELKSFDSDSYYLLLKVNGYNRYFFLKDNKNKTSKLIGINREFGFNFPREDKINQFIQDYQKPINNKINLIENQIISLSEQLNTRDIKTLKEIKHNIVVLEKDLKQFETDLNRYSIDSEVKSYKKNPVNKFVPYNYHIQKCEVLNSMSKKKEKANYSKYAYKVNI